MSGDPEDVAKTSSTAGDLTGSTVGRFTIRERLGVGGMGQVYRAQDSTLKRIVAIKRMAPELQFDERDRQRFLKEAQRASALNHPNLAAIFDVLEHNGEILLVMECIEGATLRERLKQPMSIEEFLEVAIQCGEGLAAAHDQRIVHGDIKPENIMLTPPRGVKILDFGVAKRFSLADSSQATESLASMTTSLSGTPAYMAPEVLLQKPYDGRADLFSLGLVFYEMLGGEQPFQTDSFAGTVGRVIHAEARPLNEVNRRVPAPLGDIITKMLAKDAAHRYPTAGDLVADLRAVQRGSHPRMALWRPLKSVGVKATRLFSPAVWAVVATAAVFLVVLMTNSKARRVVSGWLTHGPARQVTSSLSGLPQDKNLAVLPFVPLEGNPKLTAFGNGLVETLTAKLTQLGENHPLQIVGASEIRGKHVTTLEQARQEFGVNLGLRVSLQQSGDLLRATYALADAKTGRALGGSTINATIADPFSIEDRVANGVASDLGVELRPEERRALGSHGTSLPDAYNYYLQGRGYMEDQFKLENVSSAIILFSQALKLDPNYGFARAGLGTAYWWKYYLTKDKKSVDMAREACAKAVESGNAGAEGHACLGLLSSGTGHYEQGAVEYQRAVELDPTNDQAYMGLARAYQHLNRPDEAEKTFQRAISLRPKNPRAYMALGGFYLQQAQAAKAEQMFNREVELTPDSYRGYSDLAAAFLYQARYNDAVKPLEQSLAIRPTFDAYTNLGTAYLRMRRFSDAIRAYQQAVQLGGTQYGAWGSLGDAYHYAGDQTHAMPAYKKAVELGKQQLEVNPKDAEVLGDMADYCAMLSDRKQAMAYLHESLQIRRGDKDLLFNAAVVYEELGETAVALEWLRKSLDAGFSAATVREAPSFDRLKGDPRLQQLLQGRNN